MPIEITMPRLSDTMESGTVIKWNVKEGDKVSAGDVIADVETDKATMELPVYDDGVIAHLEVKEGQKVDVGTVIAVLAGEGEDAAPAKGAAKKAAPAEAQAKSTNTASKSAKARATAQDQADDPEAETVMTEDDEAQPKPARAASKGRSQVAPAENEVEHDDQEERGSSKPDSGARVDGRIFVSPMARRLAEEHGLDVGSIEGSGPGGRIIKRDVLAAVEAAGETAASIPPSAKRREKSDSSESLAVSRPPTSRPAELATRVKTAGPPHKAAPMQSLGFGQSAIEARIVPLSSMRQTIAKRLVESKTTIPHYQVTVTFNMDPLLALRSTLNDQLEPHGIKLSVNDFLVRGCALAIHQHPHFNSTWGEDHLEINGEVNIGIAIALPPERGGGLVVATVRNADQKGLRQISFESKALSDKARTRGLTVQEMSGSTFTISNMGMFGVDNFTAIINPPNCAVLAVGAAIEKPVVRNGALTIGHEMAATLSCDHRIIDGAMAAAYLQTLRQLIENPGTLLV